MLIPSRAESVIKHRRRGLRADGRGAWGRVSAIFEEGGFDRAPSRSAEIQVMRALGSDKSESELEHSGSCATAEKQAFGLGQWKLAERCTVWHLVGGSGNSITQICGTYEMYACVSIISIICVISIITRHPRSSIISIMPVISIISIICYYV